MRFLLTPVFALALALGSLTSVASRAQHQPTPEAIEAAQNLFGLLFDHAFGRLNDQAVTYAWPQIERAVRKNNPTLDDATFVSLRQEFARIRRERLRALVKELPNSLARHLTVQEMNDLAAFYRTPSGLKVLEAMPFVLTEGFAQVLPNLRALSDDTHEAFMALMRQRGLLRSHPE